MMRLLFQPGTKMKKNKIVFALILLVASLFCTSLCFQEPPGPYLAEAIIPNSPFRFRLLKTADKPSEYQWKAPVFEKIMWYLPKRKDRYRLHDIDLQFRGVTFFDRFPATGFLFRFVDSSGDWVNPRNSVGRLRFLESTGWIFRPDNANPEIGSGAIMESISAFPRRDRTLRIEWSDSMEKWPPAKMELPNPYYREDFPVWQPLPLPQRQTRGDLTVELTSLRPYASQSNVKFKIDFPSEPWTSGDSHEGRYVFLQDATGNTGAVLSPFEPAWKVVIRAFRSHHGNHPPDRIQSLGKYPWPMPGVVVPIDQEFTVGESQIRVHYLAGAGTVTNQNGKYAALKAMTTPAQGAKLYGSKGIHWISRPQPFVWVTFGHTAPERKILFRSIVPDELPEVTELENRLWHTHTQIITLPMAMASSPQGVELSIVDNLCEQFEFIVEPPEKTRQSVRNGEFDKD